MSINHLQETPWWQQQQSLMMESTQNSSTSNSNSSSSPSSSHKFQASAATPHPQFSSWPSPSPSPHHQQHYQQQQQHRLWLNSFDNNNNNNDPALGFINEQDIMTSRNANQEPQKEPMFEKPLTPSDVGKLNRLVIPKQHAEKYFPLGGGDSSSSSAEKGLLLSFEDESGKCWRFRYSYWNSSQSYVLTKGWSRYVKEKRLDAGDVIQFERHHTDCERLFIGWRRRGAPSAAHQDAHNNAGATSSGWPRGLGLSHYPVQTHAVTVPLFQHATAGVKGQTTSVGNSRTLRLFGVNLECQVDDEPESQAQHHRLQFTHNYSVEVEAAAAYASTNPPNHMDVTFSRDDVSQTRNRQG